MGFYKPTNITGGILGGTTLYTFTLICRWWKNVDADAKQGELERFLKKLSDACEGQFKQMLKARAKRRIASRRGGMDDQMMWPIWPKHGGWNPFTNILMGMILGDIHQRRHGFEFV